MCNRDIQYFLKGQHLNKSRQAPDEAAGHESLHVLLYTIIEIALKRLSDQIGWPSLHTTQALLTAPAVQYFLEFYKCDL